MLKLNDPGHKLALSLFVFLMLGCNSIKQNQSIELIKPEQEISDIKSLTIKQGTTVSETSQKPKLIKVSKAAPWLSQSLEASYAGNIDAKTVILSILNKQPVKFEVEGNGPPVKADPKAKTFKQHLDAIAEQANWSYSIANGVVTFSDWQVINYPIYFILGQKNINLTPSSMVTSSSGNDASNNSSQSGSTTTSLSISSDSLNELKQIMDKLIGKLEIGDKSNKKPTYSIIKSTNSILVSAPPNIQKEVKNALMTINAIAGRTIHLAFDIYSVELFETYQKALDIEVLKKAGVNVTSRATSDILSSAASAPYLLSITSLKNEYDTNIMLKALANSGKASLANKGTLLLKNNEAGDIRTTSLNRWEKIAPTNDFISKSPAFKESIIQVLPSIIGEKINLHMIISTTDNEPYLKSLTRERVTQSNSTNSTLPEYQINVEIGQIKLGEQFVIPTEVENGETLIIGGLTRKTYSDNRSKNQMLPIFGDGRDKQQRRRETIIVLTAYLSD
jgi:hypothetical protein